jgi:hypothetical protein
MQTLDVITIGRTSVDLYGVQIGGRLEDMGPFNKYIGGSLFRVQVFSGLPRPWPEDTKRRVA